MRKFLFLIAGFLLLGTTLWSASPFRLFLEGNPVTVHPLVADDKLYLPLEETAALFHFKADVDFKNGRIVLYHQDGSPALTPAAASPASATTQVVIGTIDKSVNQTADTPFFNVKVYLFKANDRYDEELDRHSIALWFLKNDPFYTDTHGKIAETTSDADGHFGFSSIPPGNYEVVAMRPLSPVEIAYWWKPFTLVKGETKELQLDSQTLTKLPIR